MTQITDDMRVYITAEAQYVTRRKEADKAFREACSNAGKKAGRGRAIACPRNHGQPIARRSHQGKISVQIARSANVSLYKAEQAITVFKRGSSKLKASVRSGDLSLIDAIKSLSKPQDSSHIRKYTKRAAIDRDFLEGLRKIAADALYEAGVRSGRPWNIENSSKMALAQGLKQILHNLEIHLSSIRRKQSHNLGQSVADGSALNRPITGKEGVLNDYEVRSSGESHSH